DRRTRGRGAAEARTGGRRHDPACSRGSVTIMNSNRVEPAGPGMEQAVPGSGIPAFTQTLGHPRPLWMLFMTEFWERFAFYGMRWALALYIVAQFYGGDASGEAPASELYGAYLALVGVQGRGRVPDHGAQPGLAQDRPGHGDRRLRYVQADHLHPGGQALRHRRPAPRLGLHHLLHGHQHGRVRRAPAHRLAGRAD